MIFQLHQKPDPEHTTQMNYTPKNGIGKLKRKVLSNLHFTHFFAKTYWSSLKLNFSNPVHHYLTFALPSAFSGSKRPIGDWRFLLLLWKKLHIKLEIFKTCGISFKNLKDFFVKIDHGFFQNFSTAFGILHIVQTIVFWHQNIM